MKLIKPSVEYIPQPEGINVNNIDQHIDRCARTCYKSENRFDENKSYDFVQRLVKSGHLAMLEHGTVYLREIRVKGADFDLQKYYNNPYSKVHTFYNENFPETLEMLVTTNMRVIIENELQGDLKYACQPQDGHDRRYTMKFICDRGVSHELVRHRVFSFAQESQRYCNYSKDKFGGVSFIEPSWFNSEDSSSEQREAFIQICQDSEECYLKLLDNWDNKKPDRRFKTGFKGNPLTPQQARCILPNATKTEIVMTGFADDWRHFLLLRSKGVTGKPHPDMKYLADKVLDIFVEMHVFNREDFV